MNIVVASLNPVKLAAAKQAFDQYFSRQDLKYTKVESASGVADQPLSVSETIQGAINRARHAALLSNADYSVGIEGGLSSVTVDNREFSIETSWACVLDCKTDKYEIGGGPSFTLLPGIKKYIQNGMDLSEAMSVAYGIEKAGERTGYIGWLTNEGIDRIRSSSDGVFLALCALLKEEVGHG